MRRLKTDAGIYGLRGSGKGVQMGVDQMKEKTGGQDGTLPEEVKEDMETAEVKTDGMDVADVDDTSDAGALGSENMDAEIQRYSQRWMIRVIIQRSYPAVLF